MAADVSTDSPDLARGARQTERVFVDEPAGAVAGQAAVATQGGVAP